MGIYSNKIVLVTGAAQGNGEGIARVVAKKGGTVILTDINETKVKETAEIIKAEAAEYGGDTRAYRMDVGDRAEVRSVVEKVIAEFGRIDVLMNNAGISELCPFEKVTEEMREKYMRVNLLGVWYCTQEVIPYMVKQNYGRIVNMSSVNGPIAQDPGEVLYSTCKAGIIGFTKSIAVEYAGKGITCNAILPGYILTPMAWAVAEMARPRNAQSVIDEISKGVPMGRMGTAEEVGYLAAFLGSDEASYITGTGVVIDGGNRLPETSSCGLR